MQLASHGARAAARNVSNLNMLSHPPGAARSYHLLRTKPSPLPQTTARKFLNETRVFLGRFFSQLTAPGIGHAPIARPVYGSATPMPTIHSRLSFPTRTLLANRGATRYFPNVPLAPRPCSVTNVGLGTARNFSTGRTVFQSFAENVPVAARAFYQVDLDIKASKERENFKKSLRAPRKPVYSKSKLRPNNKHRAVLQPVSQETSPEIEIDTYFPSSITEVTTCLLIPLAPVPSASLLSDPGGSPPRLPLPELLSMHNSYELHSLKVSSLFSRLDAANVWERGVLCSPYASRSGPEGTCTILKLEFVGWSKQEVRGVIGESGSGWCVLEETRNIAQPDFDAFSDTSSVLSGMSGDDSEYGMSSEAVTQSFVLPTLDLSASFLDLTPTAPSSDVKTDSDVWSDDDGSEGSNEWVSFSSDFLSRLQQ